MKQQDESVQEVSLDEVPPGHGVMSMMSPRHGDLRLMWDRGNEAEVGTARETFEKMTREGHVAYRATGKQGDRGEVMRTFDPEAERIIMVQQNRGG